MPVSPGKKNSAILPNRPDTKALNKLLDSISFAFDKSPKMTTKKQSKLKNISSPTAKNFRNGPAQQNLSGWLSKASLESLQTSTKFAKETGKDHESKNTTQKSPKPLNEMATKFKKDKSSTDKMAKSSKISKKSSKTKFKRFNSGSSDELLPTFKQKQPSKKLKQTETFKKYGVIIPSLDEIVADQKKFTSYKSQVQEAQTLREPTFKMPVTPEKLNQSEDHILLGCKELTLLEITEHFNNSITFLRDIIDGKRFSERHRKYFDKKNKLDDFTIKDLTYNTSTIVFTFEQLDHIVSLMQSEFDPDDKKTTYFFKVLVPELCFKIFMETHNMNKREANAYLENRPVE